MACVRAAWLGRQRSKLTKTDGPGTFDHLDGGRLDWNVSDTWVLASNGTVPVTAAGPHREGHAVYWPRVCDRTLTSARIDWIFQSEPLLRSLKDQMRGSMRGS